MAYLQLQLRSLFSERRIEGNQGNDSLKIHVLRLILSMLLLTISMAACSRGDDEDPTVPGTVGSQWTTLSQNVTPTTSDTSSATAVGPTTPTTTANDSATATVDSIASPGTGAFTDAEAALIDLLLSAGDLDGDWNQLRVEAPALSESPGICNAPRFPRADERIAEVEVEYQSADGARFVLQDITQFPEEVAVEAMEYVRESATCPEWTDDTGTVFKLSPAEAPQLGDDSHAIHIAFEVADAGTLEGDFVFSRVDGYVTIVTTLALGEYDPMFSNNVAQLAVRKIDTLVGTGKNVTDEESTLIGGLLSLDDFSEDWDQINEAHRSEPESWQGLCNSDPFPDSEDAIARVGVEFFEGFESDSATMMQLLIAYPTGLVETAFEYEQDAASCDSFSSGQTKITLTPDTNVQSLGDESFAVGFAFDNDGNTVEGYWIVIRVADMMSTLIYTDPTDLSVAEVERIATDAVDRMESIVR